MNDPNNIDLIEKQKNTIISNPSINKYINTNVLTSFKNPVYISLYSKIIKYKII